MSAEQKPLSVAQLVRAIKTVLEDSLGEVRVEGEISNFKRQNSGHCYFTLKDEWAQISCVLFKGSAMRCPVALRDGLKVRIVAETGVYEPRGQVQLVVKSLQESGLGALQQRFEELKRKLMEEGLFDSGRKRPLPPYPMSVGIITSPTGAVIQDMRHVFERRAPWIQLYLQPVRVQGDEAAGEIARALRAWSDPAASGLPSVDVLIVGRGGGSLEDLWSFNEEQVARAIAESRIPVISAVGHETDFTIADFVADLRAPTPTAAAELATPDGPALSEYLSRRWSQAQMSVSRLLERHQLRLDVYSRGILSTSPEKVLRDFIQKVDELDESLSSSVEFALEEAEAQNRELSLRLHSFNPAEILARLEEKSLHLSSRLSSATERVIHRTEERLREREQLLKALGPDSAFKRGYAMVRDPSGRIIRDPATVSPGEALSISLEKGILEAVARSFCVPKKH